MARHRVIYLGEVINQQEEVKMQFYLQVILQLQALNLVLKVMYGQMSSLQIPTNIFWKSAFAANENATTTLTIFENSIQSSNSLRERRIEVFDNKPISYSISGADSQFFSISSSTISSNTGTIDISLSARDFENPQDSTNAIIYIIDLMVYNITSK